MNNDEELLELAAKAAGINAICIDVDLTDEGLYLNGDRSPDNSQFWNPLKNDGDALRLAVKLGMSLDTALGQTLAIQPVRGTDCVELHNGDPYAATRRAIVLAAAEIGKATP